MESTNPKSSELRTEHVQLDPLEQQYVSTISEATVKQLGYISVQEKEIIEEYVKTRVRQLKQKSSNQQIEELASKFFRSLIEKIGSTPENSTLLSVINKKREDQKKKEELYKLCIEEAISSSKERVKRTFKLELEFSHEYAIAEFVRTKMEEEKLSFDLPFEEYQEKINALQENLFVENKYGVTPIEANAIPAVKQVKFAQGYLKKYIRDKIEKEYDQLDELISDIVQSSLSPLYTSMNLPDEKFDKLCSVHIDSVDLDKLRNKVVNLGYVKDCEVAIERKFTQVADKTFQNPSLLKDSIYNEVQVILSNIKNEDYELPLLEFKEKVTERIEKMDVEAFFAHLATEKYQRTSNK